MDQVAATPLTAEQLREVDAWIGAHLAEAPESVAAFLKLHRRYLNRGGESAAAIQRDSSAAASRSRDHLLERAASER
jgi:thioredoxin-like negative regulator of GroEL